MTDDEAQVLSIGSIVGGTSDAGPLWRDAIRDLGERVRVARQGVSAPINLNVVYHVPGHILAPDYEGVRTGSFRRRDRHLIVQVAVPAGMPNDAGAFVREALLDAIDAAEQWAAKRKIAPDLDDIRRIGRLAAGSSDIARH